MRDPMKTLPRLQIFIFLSAHLAYAQTPSSSAPVAQTPKPAPCVASEYRQFDFWIGDWDVTVLNGKAAGTNLIKPILGGCVLRRGAKGLSCPGEVQRMQQRARGVDEADVLCAGVGSRARNVL